MRITTNHANFLQASLRAVACPGLVSGKQSPTYRAKILIQLIRLIRFYIDRSGGSGGSPYSEIHVRLFFDFLINYVEGFAVLTFDFPLTYPAKAQLPSKALQQHWR